MSTCSLSNIQVIRQIPSGAFAIYIAVDSNLDCQSLEEKQPLLRKNNLFQGKTISCLSFLIGSLKNSSISQARMPTSD